MMRNKKCTAVWYRMHLPCADEPRYCGCPSQKSQNLKKNYPETGL